MVLDQLQVCVAAGEGFVARTAGGLLLICPGGAEDVVEGLLETLYKTCSEPGVVSARALALRLGGLVAQTGEAALPDFAAAADAENGLAVLLHGAVQARIRTEGAEQLLRGRDAVGWVDRIVERPFTSVALEPDGPGGSVADPRTDLERGVVTGRGVLLVGAPAAEERIDVPPLGAATDAVDDALATKADEEAAPDAPRTDVPTPSGLTEPLGSSVLVEGIVCENDHFNHPLARFCSLCGQGMFDRTPSYVQQPRPTLGALVLDTGVTLALETDLLVGSDPHVTADGLQPLQIWDDAGSVARDHAELRLVAWDVSVIDRGTPSGTFVWVPGATHWRRLEAGVPLVIPSGTRVAVGARTFTYTSNHV